MGKGMGGREARGNSGLQIQKAPFTKRLASKVSGSDENHCSGLNVCVPTQIHI